MNIGDMVRYKGADFAATRVHDGFLGLIIEKRSSDTMSKYVRVRWNTRDSAFQEMWHDISGLEVVNPDDKSR